MNKVEFFKKLMNNKDCDMFEVLLNLLENIGEAYSEKHRDDEVRVSSLGAEADFDRDIYCRGCVVGNKRKTELIKWRDILNEFWLQETGEWR